MIYFGCCKSASCLTNDPSVCFIGRKVWPFCRWEKAAQRAGWELGHQAYVGGECTHIRIFSRSTCLKASEGSNWVGNQTAYVFVGRNHSKVTWCHFIEEAITAWKQSSCLLKLHKMCVNERSGKSSQLVLKLHTNTRTHFYPSLEWKPQLLKMLLQIHSQYDEDNIYLQLRSFYQTSWRKPRR